VIGVLSLATDCLEAMEIEWNSTSSRLQRKTRDPIEVFNGGGSSSSGQWNLAYCPARKEDRKDLCQYHY